MEARTFKIDNYITVPGFAIIELGLSGNDLLCYSLIYGFTQDEETEFMGSLSYVASALNVTRQNAKKVIDRLIERGLVDKREMFFSGVKFCHYVAKRNGVAESATGRCRNNNGGVAETVTGGVAKSATNITNKDITNDNDKDIAADGGLFPEMVQKKVKHLFSESPYFDKDKFLERFQGEYEAGVDVEYYYNAVADWSASNGQKKMDWIATARNWMRKDDADGKLRKRMGRGVALSPDAVDYLKSMAD